MPGIKPTLPKHATQPSSSWDLANSPGSTRSGKVGPLCLRPHTCCSLCLENPSFICLISIHLSKPNHPSWYPPLILYLLSMHGIWVRILPAKLIVCFHLCEFFQLISKDMSAWALHSLPTVPSKQWGCNLSGHDPQMDGQTWGSVAAQQIYRVFIN